ncbi:MarR family winged helix-turn-helix transcriptional regulator [Catelliglobosispora koreensis]|uniref:MarR family winged helix-turn-helix transcriptional regulator n=1 Tax=Catelliglobosispora koreensis TaxID=129052 RepID=UPI00035E46FE|nr:MarR family transcriptional regulator [Catelliglobosispora koreensis]
MAQLSILFDVFALGQQVRTLLTQAMADGDLRADEYAAYSVVFEAEPLTMTELARALGMPLTTAADYVRAMQSRGHLRKEPHPSDSRARLLALTTSGRAAHRQAALRFEEAYQAFAAELQAQGVDEHAARALLQRMAACAGQAASALHR